MNSNEMMETRTARAINAYCRVLELQVKVVEQMGLDPRMAASKLAEAVEHANTGLCREVALLRFLREEAAGAEIQGFTEST